MKKLCYLIFVSFWVLAIAAQGMGRETGRASGTGEKGSAIAGKPHKARAARSNGGAGVVGVVTGFNAEGKVISVRGGGRTISFDASNPMLKGFRRLEDVKAGSFVAIAYTAGGLRITKASLIGGGSKEPDFNESGGKAAAKKTGRKSMRVQMKGTGFRDVDENKDGKVTPVELSVVCKELTMKQFREYDRDGDGCLNETEFRAVTRDR